MSKYSRAVAERLGVSRTDSRGKHRLAFTGLYLLTLLMYIRPQELMPELFGSLPLVKIVAIGTLLIYIVSKLSAGERVITWPLEMKMMTLMWVTGFLLMPIALSPQDSFTVLFDPLIKALIVFIILINLVETRARLRLLLHAMVFSELLFALGGIKTFLTGGYGGKSFNHRIEGLGTMFANPNDLASVLTVMLPFAVIFALTRQGMVRLFYFVCAGVGAVAVLFTFSRSGFLALVLSLGLIVWKLSRGRRARIWFAAVVIAGVLSMAMPGTYWVRLSTIFNPETDTTNSAQERREVMKRAAELAVKRSIIGIGAGNFYIYSIKEMRAHNSYLETAAELGLVGLIAYLVLIFAPMRSLRRVQHETRPDGARPERELHIISICLQASFVAYIIYGFFGSVQYLYFLYFNVAYVVAFRQILAAEKLADAQANVGTGALESPARPGLAKGTLWRPHRVRQLWLTDGNR